MKNAREFTAERHLTRFNPVSKSINADSEIEGFPLLQKTWATEDGEGSYRD